MRYTARSSAFLVAMIALFAACSGGGDGSTTQPAQAARVGFSDTSFTFVALGASQAVTAFVKDAGGQVLQSAPVVWSSDDPLVADVAGNGKSASIIARRAGVTNVRATSGPVSSTVIVFVLGVRSVALSATSAVLRVGAQHTLNADVAADSGVSRSINWRSSNSAVATVDAAGVVTALAPGLATITAAAAADATKLANIDVTVLASRAVTVTPATASLGSGVSLQLTASVLLDEGLPETVTWSSSAPLIATVSERGVVTGIAPGSAIITATSTTDGSLQGTATVNVVPIVRQVTIATPPSTPLFLGQTRVLVATVTADAGVAQTVNWTSSNTAIATVSAGGVVTAVTAGQVTITAFSTADPTRSASVTLAVASRPVAIALSATTAALTVGNSSTIAATVTADPGVSTAVTWTTNAPGIATVSGGVVTAVANGAAIITATSAADPAVFATVAVSVGPRLATTWNATGLAGVMIENIVSTYVAAPASVFTVNSRGDVFHFDGLTWTRAAQGSAFGTTFQAVHGSGSDNVVAVGTGGKIVVWNGATWQAVASGTTTDLSDVWVDSPTSALAVGSSGMAVRLAGTTWAPAPTTAVGERLNAVWGAGNDGWFAVGTNGTVLRYAAGVWTRATVPSGVNLRDVYGNTDTDVYAVGEIGTVLRFTGNAWSTVPPNGVSSDLFSVNGTTQGGGKVFIGGDRIALQVVNGVLDIIPADVPYSVQFLSTSVLNGVLWMGGERGLAVRYGGAAWETMNIAPDLIDVWSTSATNAWTVGEFGFIYRYNGVTWARQNSPTLTRLNTVWGSSATDAYAGGDGGLLLKWDGNQWSPMASPTSGDILSLWGSSSSNVYATTYNGEVLRWNGSAWSVATTQANPLYAIYGSSATNVFAAGDGGTVLRFDGTAWSTMNTGSSALLAGVWASSPGNAFTVGVLNGSAASYRFLSSWQPINVGVAAELTSVWGASASDLYVSGGSGTILRWDGASWLSMQTGTFEYLWALTGAPDGTGGAWAVGFNATLVTGTQSGAVRVAGATAAMRQGISLEPTKRALQSRIAARAVPQGAARRSLRLSHAKRVTVRTVR